MINSLPKKIGGFPQSDYILNLKLQKLISLPTTCSMSTLPSDMEGKLDVHVAQKYMYLLTG